MKSITIHSVDVPMEYNPSTKEFGGILKLSKVAPRFDGSKFGIDGSVFCYIFRPKNEDLLIARWKIKGEGFEVGPLSFEEFIPILEQNLEGLV